MDPQQLRIRGFALIVLSSVLTFASESVAETSTLSPLEIGYRVSAFLDSAATVRYGDADSGDTVSVYFFAEVGEEPPGDFYPGFYGVQFRALYPANIQLLDETFSSIVSISSGTTAAGIQIGLVACSLERTLLVTARCLQLDSNPSMIDVVGFEPSEMKPAYADCAPFHSLDAEDLGTSTFPEIPSSSGALPRLNGEPVYLRAPGFPLLKPVGDFYYVGSDRIFIELSFEGGGGGEVFYAENLPPNSSFTPATGQFLWDTPDSVVNLSHMDVVMGIQNAAGSTFERITFNSRGNRAPILTPIADQAVLEGDTLVLDLVGTDLDGDSLAYSADPIRAELGAVWVPPNRYRMIPPPGSAGTVHNVTFSVSDGYATDSEQVEITIGSLPPVFGTLPPRKTVHELEWVVLEVTAVDPEGSPVTLKSSPPLNYFGPADGFYDFDPSRGLFRYHPSLEAAGSYSVTFTASDGLDSSTATVGIGVARIPGAPAFDEVNDKTAEVGKELQFLVKVSADPWKELDLRAEELPEGATFDAGTGQFVWLPDITQLGTHVAYFEVTDGSLEDHMHVNIEVIPAVFPPPNQPPEFGRMVQPLRGHLCPSDSVALEVVASDPDGDSLTYWAYPILPAYGASWIPPNKLVIHPPDPVPAFRYTVWVYASDGKDTISRKMRWFLDDNCVPRIDSLPPPLNVLQLDTLAVDLDAFDPNGDAITYSMSWSIPPKGFYSFDETTGSLTFVPSLMDAGIYQPYIEVNDNLDWWSWTSVSLSIQVDPIPGAPRFETLPKASIPWGSEFSFVLQAEDDPADNLIYSMLAHPTGATLDPVSGLFSWTPAQSQVGSHVVKFAVTDGSLSDEVNLNIVVEHHFGTLLPFWNGGGTQTTLELHPPQQATLYLFLHEPAGAKGVTYDVHFPDGITILERDFPLTSSNFNYAHPYCGFLQSWPSTRDYPFLLGKFTLQIDTDSLVADSIYVAAKCDAASPQSFVGSGKRNLMGGTAYFTSSVAVEEKKADPGADSPPKVTRLLGVAPNPFNPATTFRFELGKDEHVQLIVYDVKGRRVAAVYEGMTKAGRYAIPWNGVDDRGVKLSSGVYFYSMKTPSFRDRGKFVILK